MIRYLPVLSKSQLFAEVKEEEIVAMLSCLNASVKTYRKGEYVFRQGEQLSTISLLLSGELYLQRDDYWGNRNIINIIRVGEIFGEAYALPGSEAILHNVIAVDKSIVLSFDAKRIINTCSSACQFHSQVVQNLFYTISEKNRKLMQKLSHMSNRSTREKLMSYLSEESARQKSATVFIPFNRQQLADFLSVDRSAMSHELSKMRDEGIIRFAKNQFTLISKNG